MFLVDKYKLEDLKDVIFHKDLYKQLLCLEDLKENKSEEDLSLKNIDKIEKDPFINMPHLYFYGPHGSPQMVDSASVLSPSESSLSSSYSSSSPYLNCEPAIIGTSISSPSTSPSEEVPEG